MPGPLDLKTATHNGCNAVNDTHRSPLSLRKCL